MNPVNELLEFVQEPKKKDRTPSNWALYAALAFANIVFLVIDGISGWTVYLMTAWVGYGILTGLAGFIPLLLHEAAFVRAFASYWQKWIAVVGALLAIASVLVIGICAAVINVMGIGLAVQTAEIFTVISLVVIAAIHALLLIVYFYIDDGIQATQKTERAIANSIHKGRLITAGGRVLAQAQGAVALKKALERQHGPQGVEALTAILSQLTRDENHDGIPDVLQRQARPMAQYNQMAERTSLGPNHGSGEDNPNS